MKDYCPHDPLNIMGEAYEQLVEKTMTHLHIDESRTDKSIPHTIHRLDYNSIVYPSRGNTESGFPVLNSDMTKVALLNIVAHAADQTTLELNRLRNLRHSPDEARSGEQTGNL